VLACRTRDPGPEIPHLTAGRAEELIMAIDRKSLSAAQARALTDAVNGKIVLHNGLWGAEMCYMWAGSTPGFGEGRVPVSESEALNQLTRLGLVRVLPGNSVTDVPVVATRSGSEFLSAGHDRLTA
jgi:hypothetical protein